MGNGIPMFDFDRVGVAVLSTSVKRVGNINVTMYIPFVLPRWSLVTYNGLYRPLILFLGDKGVFWVQYSKYKMFLQLNIKSTYWQSFNMWNHVNMKWNLRADNMCGSGYLDGILTFVGPEILDTLMISNSHMPEVTWDWRNSNEVGDIVRTTRICWNVRFIHRHNCTFLHV